MLKGFSVFSCFSVVDAFAIGEENLTNTNGFYELKKDLEHPIFELKKELDKLLPKRKGQEFFNVKKLIVKYASDDKTIEVDPLNANLLVSRGFHAYLAGRDPATSPKKALTYIFETSSAESIPTTRAYECSSARKKKTQGEIEFWQMLIDEPCKVQELELEILSIPPTAKLRAMISFGYGVQNKFIIPITDDTDSTKLHAQLAAENKQIADKVITQLNKIPRRYKRMAIPVVALHVSEHKENYQLIHQAYAALASGSSSKHLADVMTTTSTLARISTSSIPSRSSLPATSAPTAAGSSSAQSRQPTLPSARPISMATPPPAKQSLSASSSSTATPPPSETKSRTPNVKSLAPRDVQQWKSTQMVATTEPARSMRGHGAFAFSAHNDDDNNCILENNDDDTFAGARKMMDLV